MREFNLQQKLLLPLPREEVFPFFADARNLELITPAWLSFEVLTPAPIEMRVGTRIDYRLRIHGVPMRWQSEITTWDPPCCFLDEQTRGPYRRWIHKHRFEECDGGTLCVDDVHYAVFGGQIIESLFVRPDLEQIFTFRRERLRYLLTGQGQAILRQGRQGVSREMSSSFLASNFRGQDGRIAPTSVSADESRGSQNKNAPAKPADAFYVRSSRFVVILSPLRS